MTMTLEGEGQMTRGFLDVDDVFLVCLELAELDQVTPHVSV